MVDLDTMPIRLALILTAAMTLPALFAQKAKDNGADWPMYNRDLASTRFSPLTQINTTNVSFRS